MALPVLEYASVEACACSAGAEDEPPPKNPPIACPIDEPTATPLYTEISCQYDVRRVCERFFSASSFLLFLLFQLSPHAPLSAPQCIK